ncbi:hypothetical protein [Microbacterium sp. MM2322]|uniref:hypothetical protein n=1 Tax=Microbacterium sp. MM2322 TaxID=3157631 RepID=UPI0032D56945
MRDHEQIQAELRDAAESGSPVRLERRRGKWQLENVYGYVLDMAGDWVALHKRVDGVYIDGYSVIRVGDVARVKPDHRNGYVDRAMDALGRPNVTYSLPANPTTRDILRSAADHSLLTCIHLEMDVNDPMIVGRITGLGARKYDLQFIDASGVWDPEPDRWWYGEATRVEFGDRYSAALERFGDPPPPRPR